MPIEFVYYEGTEHGEGVYFGYGKIVSPPAKDKREPGYSFAEVVDYKPFLEPVPFKDGEREEPGSRLAALQSAEMRSEGFPPRSSTKSVSTAKSASISGRTLT